MPASNDVGFVITDSTDNDILNPKGFSKGFDPSQIPVDLPKPIPIFGDLPGQIKEFSDSELLARTQELWERKATLWHLRQIAANGQQMPTLDQNGQGYCWAYSVTRGVQYVRAFQNQPYRRLSAHAVGCKIKNFRDEGAWCGLSYKFIMENGVPSIDFWPEKSMSRSNDKPEVWENAAGNRILEGYFDPAVAVYNQSLTLRQELTLLCLNIPVAADRNRWSHSTLDHTPIIKDGQVWPMGDNSWTDGWGDNGSYVFQGNSMARTDGAVAIRAVAAGVS